MPHGPASSHLGSALPTCKSKLLTRNRKSRTSGRAIGCTDVLGGSVRHGWRNFWCVTGDFLVRSARVIGRVNPPTVAKANRDSAAMIAGELRPNPGGTAQDLPPHGRELGCVSLSLIPQRSIATQVALQRNMSCMVCRPRFHKRHFALGVDYGMIDLCSVAESGMDGGQCTRF